jgi:uncharacterized protein YbaA (DUF1428 family)
MASYVEGFLLPIPKKNLAAYRRMSRRAGKIWREYGALEYRECVGDDTPAKGPASFPRRVRAERGELVVFSWIVYKSKADRKRISAEVMKDPRLADLTVAEAMPFDMRRMSVGGFRIFVEE